MIFFALGAPDLNPRGSGFSSAQYRGPLILREVKIRGVAVKGFKYRNRRPVDMNFSVFFFKLNGTFCISLKMEYFPPFRKRPKSCMDSSNIKQKMNKMIKIFRICINHFEI